MRVIAELFVNDVERTFKKRGITDVSLSIQDVHKANKSTKAIIVRYQNESISPCIDIDRLEEHFSPDETYIEMIDSFISLVQKLRNAPKFDMSWTMVYEEVKNKLFLQLISKENNEEFLCTVPYQTIEDMAVICRVDLGTSGAQRGTVCINKEMLHYYGISSDQLFADAIENSLKKKPAKIQKVVDILPQDIKELYEEIDYDLPLWIATASDTPCGASVITYPGFLKQVADEIGGSYYIFPSSTHELVLLADNKVYDVCELKNMVKEINFTQVSKEDRLTDNVYHYDAESDVFETIDCYEERKVCACELR